MLRYRSKTITQLEQSWHKKCDKCNYIKPLRAHHCSVCNQCVFAMDHHCRNLKFIVLCINSMGKQLPWPGELQILLAIYFVSFCGSIVQCCYYCFYLEPSHLQTKLFSYEFCAHLRRSFGNSLSWFQWLELVLSFNRIFNN